VSLEDVQKKETFCSSVCLKEFPLQHAQRPHEMIHSPGFGSHVRPNLASERGARIDSLLIDGEFPKSALKKVCVFTVQSVVHKHTSSAFETHFFFAMEILATNPFQCHVSKIVLKFPHCLNSKKKL